MAYQIDCRPQKEQKITALFFKNKAVIFSFTAYKTPID